MIETVRGPVAPSDLGRVLAHEHVILQNPELRLNFPDFPQARSDEEIEGIAVSKLQELCDRGIDTILDCTAIGLGRDVARLKRINECVDLNIVVASGFYTFSDLPYPFMLTGPGSYLGGDEEPMATLMLREFEEGIADTGVKPGFMKCAIEDHGLTSGLQRVFAAVAKVHGEIGAPITVHSNPDNRSGLVAQMFLRDHGVDLSRVVIGHSNDTDDVDYLCELADNGSILGMDSFGMDFLLPFESRIDTLVRMVELGYAEKMVLSGDSAAYMDWASERVREERLPNWHYTHLLDDVIPELRRRGVSEESLRIMLVDVPRDYLTVP